MGRIEKTVFISYRRTNVPWALAIYQNLTMHGYDVFFDFQSIDSGNFEKVIIENIKARAHFIVILTPSALERCKEPNDWFRREIETAMNEKRNIIPLMLESFDFGSPLVTQALTGKLATLNRYNGLRVPAEYFFEAMEKLRQRYLSVALSDISLPLLNAETREITETQKSVASEAAPVNTEQLTAQEWFERGYVFGENNNFDEAIRCYTEAIRLKPNLAESYNNRGNARYYANDLMIWMAQLQIMIKPCASSQVLLMSTLIEQQSGNRRKIIPGQLLITSSIVI
jgi:tetratricopeptide (TPR) repeat protein